MQQKRNMNIRIVGFGLAWLVMSQSVAAKILFYASFDKSVHADFAVGKRTATGNLLPLTKTSRKPWGRALNAFKPRADRTARFDTKGNLNLNRGTIEFFAKIEKAEGRRPNHYFFTFSGAQPFTLGVGTRPNAQGLVLGYNCNGTHGWSYYSERFVFIDHWQHYAITWDLTAGKGKGKLSIFVDGVRRIHSDKLNPFRFGVERLYIGGKQTPWGYIDDFAIFDEVLYQKNFVPRKATLAKVAKATKSGKPGDVHQTLLGHPFLHNGGFENWQDGKPVGWQLQRGEVRMERVMRIAGRRALALYVDRKESHPWPHSLIKSDPFVLEPNSQYRMSLWVATPGTVGDLRFDIASAGGGVVSSYRSGWTTRHPWLQVNQKFRTRDNRQHYMTLSAQSAFGHPVWIDGISIKKIGGASSTNSAAERFQLFSRSVMESLDVSKTLPAAAEIINSMHIRLARGEFEPGMVGLHAQRTLKDVDLKLAGPLVGPKGSTISPANVVVRRLNGEVLPLSRPRSVRAGDIIAWWITVKAERNCPPGEYRGTLHVTSGSERLRQLPILVEVMDLQLPEPDIAFLMYHHEHYFPKQFLTPKLQQAYYRDMNDHGKNTVTVYNNGDVDGTKKVNFSKNYGYDVKHPLFSVGLDTQMKWILNSGLCKSGQPVLWLPSRTSTHDGKGYGWGGLPEAALRATLKKWQKRKWSEPLLYAVDEPGGEGQRAKEAVDRLQVIKSWKLPVRTTTAGLDPSVLGKYYDVWIAGDADVSVKSAMLAEKLKAELWTYNCTCNHKNMPFSRAFYGFWAFRTGVKGVAQWAYYDNPHWTANVAGDPGGNPRTRLSRICPSPNGPIPTLSWEATREGIDDYRYAQALRDSIKTAEKRLAQLNRESARRLSKEDRETIEKRERQRIAQIVAKKKPIVWKPKDANQAKGEKLFLVARKLTSSLRAAKQAMVFVIDTIPFDAMKTRGYLSYHAPRWTRFCPPLGPAGLGENPRTTTELRRRILTSYILSLKQHLPRSVATP